jgi:hypothetical protein
MRNALTRFSFAEGAGAQPSLRAFTFAPTRLTLAQMLVVFSFIWPFFNYQLVDPSSLTEINFLPVILAALLVPEITLREKWSLLLSLPVFAVALIWANPTAWLRLAVGIIPLHFVLNLTRHLKEQGRELIPSGLAYRTLIVFVVFCMMQTLQFNLFPVIPEWLTAALMQVVPRYSAIPYDDAGIRGVQGWASEPSSAALICVAFSLVAIRQRPQRRWRVLALFALFVLLNKSIYALVLLILLALGCLFASRKKLLPFLALIPMSLALSVYITRSGRLVELHNNLLVSGVNSEFNKELMRFAQMFYPLKSFPQIYSPPNLYGSLVMEPMGLLPLLTGYGSVLGLVWLAHIVGRNFPLRQVALRPLALVAGLVLFMMTTPDLIPCVVALAVFLVPRTVQAASAEYHEGDPSSAAASNAGGAN